MNRFCAIAISILVVIRITQTMSVAAAQEGVAPTTAPETLSVFFSALAKGDVNRLVALTAPLHGVPDEVVRQEYTEALEFAKTSVCEVVAHLQLGNTAVVIFREEGPGKTTIVDLDPAFLVRRDARWLVVFELTTYDSPYHEFDEATLANLKKLQEWYQSQKPQLQRMLGGA